MTHIGLGRNANGNIGLGGCLCSDGIPGLVGTPRARAGLDNKASGDIGLSGCPLAGHDGRVMSSMVACGGTCSLMVGRSMSNLADIGYTLHLVDLPSG